MTAEAAPGTHGDAMEAVYGPGARTVPGMTVDGEPVHGSRAILARVEEMVPSPALFPAGRADAVAAAEAWGDEELQDLGRRLTWGAMHVRPEAMGTFGGDVPNAADLQIGATIRVLLTLGDLEPLLAGRAGERIARRWFADYPGHVPAGAFPAGWVPAR